MSKTVLIIHAQPEPTSLTRHLVGVSRQSLQAQGHTVLESDLYAMRWKAVFDADDFPQRANPDRLSFGAESGHAYATGQQTADVVAEQAKVLAADAVIFQFPLWWFGMPAIMKGWIDRVWAAGLAHQYKNAGNAYRYGAGAFQGKRALLAVSAGGPETDYAPRGIDGPIEQLLFPITHGSLHYPGFDVLPTFAVYGAGRMGADQAARAEAAWRLRLDGLFTDAPIPFRPQNGGDYTRTNELKPHVAAGQTGLIAHIAQTAKKCRHGPWKQRRCHENLRDLDPSRRWRGRGLEATGEAGGFARVARPRRRHRSRSAWAGRQPGCCARVGIRHL